MKTKPIILCITVTLLITLLLVVTLFKNNNFEEAQTVFQVYLDGKKIGSIKDDEELYTLINEDQREIKETYNVDRVYPPNGFDIIRHLTYRGEISDANDIYKKIKEEKAFTIKGYIVTIRGIDEEEKELIQEIYVLDENVFKTALEKVVTTFVTAERLEQYLTDTQSKIIDTGETIKKMELSENITIKEGYIDSNARIFLDEKELTQYLLFGDNYEQKNYTVKAGDTIESISNDNQLNVQEFLIANPVFTNKNNILAIGEEVNITLINPVLTLIYDMEVIKDEEIKYETETKYDYSKYSSYRQVEQEGENGIKRNTIQVRVVNGEEQQGAQITGEVTIKPVVNEIVVRGYRSGGGNAPNISGSTWVWPTAQPYYISSEYTWRWGKHHDGIDITGSGWGSPIYAVQGGTVISAGQGSHIIGGSMAGIAVTIDHHNGYYTLYAHMSKAVVTEGQEVTKGQKIGEMGNTGNVSPRPSKANPTAGTHLHFSVFVGYPYQGGYTINPRNLWK